MNEYLLSIYIFIGLLIIVFLIDYFLINKKKLNLIKNKGLTKKGKKKKIKSISEIDYLTMKFKLNKKNLNMDRMIIMISLINAFIISVVSSIVMLMPFAIMWQLIVAFALLFGLIYALYEIYGRHLKKEEEKKWKHILEFQQTNC